MNVLRAGLLVALALGVCGMHTLGHLDGRHSSSSSTAHGMQAPAAVVAVVPAGMEAFVPDGEMPAFDPTEVCLAVLMTLVVLLLIAAWTRVGRRRDDESETRSSAGQIARPPPKLASRRLAILSTLRI
ncbi:DUF6153 family protein [Nonomuraea zeae]|uniref:Uncharacterized protein n=1 Tax=Nonomuraea zeae TaxID=1642303 RepID=A0A5S4HEJ3_9ACTN|nr:DUF6153 family protein [Nonomuraea zeae]TMR37320.1 hypothetical protein ETD85_08195 [Nonomuraea zeae]